LKSNPKDAAAVAPHLRRVFCIGEALMTATCRELIELIPEVEIHNLYGPTEASVGVSHFPVTAATLPGLSSTPVVPIGAPFGYVSFRIMDPAKYEGKAMDAALLTDVPEGTIGELFIGGDCLAHGYINDATKTGAAFFDFPGVQARPEHAASRFGLYKTGDLVRRRADGIFEYMGRSDFQVKIGGVRIECEEVSSVLKLHPAVQDALVCAFDGPFGKALAAYVVTDQSVDWQHQPGSVAEQDDRKTQTGEAEDDGDKDLVSKWGAVYDEMYQDSGEGVSEGDPTLNWSGYVDTYSRRTHAEPVIKEWVEWSCELVLRHKDLCFPEGRVAEGGRPPCVVELGCGNGMLLFRIAPVVAKSTGGRYVGTDISNSGLSYVHDIMARGPPYKGLPIETHKIAAHEILDICKQESVGVVLCNGVTMYFPSTAYLVECMQTAVKATATGGFSIFGDIQSKRHLMSFHTDVQTFQAMRRPDATPQAVLRAARKAAATEQLSYFDDALIYRLEQAGKELFGGRLVRFEMGLKRGWWHSEFNRFRYDVELVVGETSTAPPPTFQRRSFADVCKFLGRPCVDEAALAGSDIQKYVQEQVQALGADADGLVITLPNARVLRPVRLLAWLEQAVKDGRSLHELPTWLHPVDMELGGSTEPELAKYGAEPEALFEMQLPKGWTQRVLWAEGDLAMLELVVLRDAAAERQWLSGVRSAAATTMPSDEELASYKNNQAEYREVSADDSQKLAHDALRLWASSTSLLPAMRPLVYVQLEEFPKNAAGKTDRGKLPSAAEVLEKVSDATALVFEAPTTDEEAKMAKLWEEVLKAPVGISTPFLAYGANSLVALSLSSKIHSAFGVRPDLAFLMSEDCTVAALVKQLQAQASGAEGGDGAKPAADGCIVRLSPESKRGISLLIVGAAGTSAMTYQPMVEHFETMQVYAVELPGRGRRVDEALESDFEVLRRGLQSDVERWATGRNFIVWGDSLGAILAYELIHHMGDSKAAAGILGLTVSGNAGPTLAAVERGMGESVQDYLGREVASVADMSDADWDKFFLAANAEDAESMREMLANPEIRRQAMGPLIADCGAYESYKDCAAKALRCPILTLRGSKDQITAGGAMESWKLVAGGRVEHRILQGVGHMIAKEAPHRVAKIVENRFLPDFTEHLNEYRGFRAAYERQRRNPAGRHTAHHHGGKAKAAFHNYFTPVLGATGVPKDADHSALDFNLDALEGSETLTPSTMEMRKMRFGNAQWRLGQAKGNPLRNPH